MNYDAPFYQINTDSGLRAARCFIPWLLGRIPVRSIVDVGCSTGTWLNVCTDHGATRVFGMDGAWVPRDRLRIPPDSFLPVDLEQPLPEAGRFDLALNLEVAEHLSPNRADSLIADLCSLAPLVLFSAAIPGQGGVHHVNEQIPAYWWQRFSSHGYHPIDLRQHFWDRNEVDWWYRQNLLLYVSGEALQRWPAVATLDAIRNEPPLTLVHPHLYDNYRFHGLRHAIRSIGPALRRTLNRRLRAPPAPVP